MSSVKDANISLLTDIFLKPVSVNSTEILQKAVSYEALNIWDKVFLLQSDLKVVCEFLFGSGALLFDVQQLPVVVQHDHQLVGVTQTQVRQNRRILQVFSPLLIGQKSLQEITCKHKS